MKILFKLLFTIFLPVLLLPNNMTHDKLKKINETVSKLEQAKLQIPTHMQKIDDFVYIKYNKIKTDIKKGHNSDYYQMATKYTDRLVPINEQGALLVKITLSDSLTKVQVNEYIDWLKENEVEVTSYYFPDNDINWHPEIFCYIPFEKLETIALNKQTRTIGIVDQYRKRAGVAETEGDVQLKAKMTREQKNIDGSGFKVGVISDGIQGFGDSQSNGDLGTVSYLNGHENITGREGRAMMEIIYDLAPGVELMFGSSKFGNPPSSSQMSTTITDLKDYGCKIIVDDVGWITDPWFQDGALAQHISNKIESDNIIYISAAGNDAKAMYSGLFDNNLDGNWHQFYDADIQNFTTLLSGETIDIYLQWADEWENPDSDYDLYLFDVWGNELISSKTRQGSGYSNKPREYVSYENTGQSAQNVFIQVKYVSGSDHRQIAINTYPYELNYTHAKNKTNKYQIYGHPAAVGVISVAAYPAQNESTLEDFSSYGPTLIYSSTSGDIERETPTITATDNVETTMDDQDPAKDFNPFPGTSAAAPHIAGIAALYLDSYGWNNNSPENFYSDLTTSCDGIAGYTGKVWNKHSGYGKANAFESLGGGPFAITIDQRKSIGTSVSNVAHWESNWIDYTIPYTFYWEEDETHILRANINVLESEKFHDWDSDQYINHKSFEINSGISNITAYLSPVKTATVSTNLLSGGTGGDVEFKDPWFRDFDDPPYGFHNRGGSAIFKSMGSSYIISPSSMYQGVFLNQGLTDGQWIQPYYSVSAEFSQIIPFHGTNVQWIFQSWEGTGVTFQSAQNTETAVVFNQANAIASAVYKGHLASDNSRATGYNGGRRVYKYDYGTHVVYEDNGAIWYTKSLNEGNTWSNEIRLEPLYTGNICRNPSIAGVTDKLIVVFEEQEPGQSETILTYHYFDNGSWHAGGVISGEAVGFGEALPVLSSNYSARIACAWRFDLDDEESGIHIYSSIFNFTDHSWSTIETVPGGSNGYPTIEWDNAASHKIALVWPESNHLHYI